MPLDATKTSKPDLSTEISALCEAADQFVARERGEAIMRKWLTVGDVRALSEFRQLCMGVDAVILTQDLLRSQPSPSGATAFDRLAKSRARAAGPEKAALAALCGARFRLLRLDGQTGNDATLRDVKSGETLCLVGADLPKLEAGTALFGRIAALGDGLCCRAGALSPLDTAALAIATSHPAAGKDGAAAAARWAEAVYAHIVRHGTLDVPGLNRPRPGIFDLDDDQDDDALLLLGAAWTKLGDDRPGLDLLQETRGITGLQPILEAVNALARAREAQESAVAGGLERMLLVLIETVLRRERTGCGTLTLDGIAQEIDAEIARNGFPREGREVFRALRQRVAGGSASPGTDDAALARLMQRIQGLRAKTVAQGCTEQEALAAAEKVAELLDRYGLSLGELDFRTQPCDGVAVQTRRRRAAPVDGCIPAIAAFFDCRVWLEHAKGEPLRYIFFGLRADVAAAQYLQELVERAFETETDRFRAGDLYARMEGERRSATNSFQVGMASGICEKLRVQRASRDAHLRSASGRDLVPVKAAMVEEEMAKLGLDLHTRNTGGARRVLSAAFAVGREAGQRFEFTPAISQAA